MTSSGPDVLSEQFSTPDRSTGPYVGRGRVLNASGKPLHGIRVEMKAAK